MEAVSCSRHGAYLHKFSRSHDVHRGAGHTLICGARPEASKLDGVDPVPFFTQRRNGPILPHFLFYARLWHLPPRKLHSGVGLIEAHKSGVANHDLCGIGVYRADTGVYHVSRIVEVGVRDELEGSDC